MIDVAAFLAACEQPYDPARANCFTAVAAAFPNDARVRALAERWQATDAIQRARLATEVDLRALCTDMARVHGFRALEPGAAPTGREIGLAHCPRIGLPPTLCAGLPGAWFARGITGAYRLRSRHVVAAWSVAECRP